uniref:Receptor activity modifying protein 2 n=1 Tax=Podarcis muralis TaxID=64176 RepID=A0A670K2Z4_PODMU
MCRVAPGAACPLSDFARGRHTHRKSQCLASRGVPLSSLCPGYPFQAASLISQPGRQKRLGNCQSKGRLGLVKVGRAAEENVPLLPGRVTRGGCPEVKGVPVPPHGCGSKGGELSLTEAKPLGARLAPGSHFSHVGCTLNHQPCQRKGGASCYSDSNLKLVRRKQAAVLRVAGCTKMDGRCLPLLLLLVVFTVYSILVADCWRDFEKQMANITEEHWCEWMIIRRPYNELRECLERWAERLKYGYPNTLAHNYITYGHRVYFLNCSVRNALQDPPDDILLPLILTPICLIPFLVTLVVLKSKDGEMKF